MYGRLQKAVDRLNNVVQEGLTAIRAVKAFVRGEYEEEKFQGVNSELMETSQRPSASPCSTAGVPTGHVYRRCAHHVARRKHGAQ